MAAKAIAIITIAHKSDTGIILPGNFSNKKTIFYKGLDLLRLLKNSTRSLLFINPDASIIEELTKYCSKHGNHFYVFDQNGFNAIHLDGDEPKLSSFEDFYSISSS